MTLATVFPTLFAPTIISSYHIQPWTFRWPRSRASEPCVRRGSRRRSATSRALGQSLTSLTSGKEGDAHVGETSARHRRALSVEPGQTATEKESWTELDLDLAPWGSIVTGE